MSLRTVLCVLVVSGSALAQDTGTQPSATPPQPSVQVEVQTQPATPPSDAQMPPTDAQPPPPDQVTAQPDAPPPDLAPPEPQQPVTPAVPEGAMLDGQLREGAFLSGPGSLAFILHHTIMGAAGGLAVEGFANQWHTDQSAREAMLVGTLVGAGLGFGSSAWWQFNHWIDRPVAYYGIANSAAGALFLLGVMDLLSNDPSVLAWSAIIGAELGAWLTATIGGGQMPARHGLLMASGAGWGAAYAALLMAIIGNSGQPPSGERVFDVVAIATGLGAGAMALTTLRYDPSTTQILRADLFGAGVGGGVLVLSALVLGSFKGPTPYVLSFLSATGAMAAVSLLWEESAERSPAAIYYDSEAHRPYSNVWW